MNDEDPHIMDYEMKIAVLRNLLVGDMNDRSDILDEPRPAYREAINNFNLEAANTLLKIITPEFYEESLEAYKKNMDWHQGKITNTFPMVLLYEAIQKLMSVAFVYLPKMIGRDEAFGKIKSYLELHWEDEVTINDWR